MAAPTTFPNFDFSFTELGDQTAPILAESSLAGSHTIVIGSDWPGDTSKAVIVGARTPAGKYMTMYIAAGGWSDAQNATLTTRPMSRNSSDIAAEDTANDFDLPAGTIIFPVVSSFYLRYMSQALLGTISSARKHSARETFDTAIPAAVPVHADLATGTAAITSPANGDSFYATTEGQFYDYVGGAWTARASGVNPNASTTVAGKVEEATAAEMGAGTAAGGSGARLFVNPSNLVKTSSGAGDENKVPVLDATGKLATGFVNAALPSTLTAKGSTYVASAASTVAELAVGSDGQTPIADVLATNGIRYGYPEVFPMTTDWTKTEVGTAAETFRGMDITLTTSASTNDASNRATRLPVKNGQGTASSGMNYNHLVATDVLDVTFRLTLGSLSNSNFAIGIHNASDLVTNKESTGNKAIVKYNGSTLESSTADGSAEEDQTIAGITATDMHTYRIVYTAGTDVKFYVDGVLKNTHTTNIPLVANSATIWVGAGIKTTTTATATCFVDGRVFIRFPRS